jgi:hypothetical protein
MAATLRQRRWRGVFAEDGALLGTVEQVANGRWWVYSGGRFIGVVQAADQAAELIERINNGGDDEGGQQ